LLLQVKVERHATVPQQCVMLKLRQLPMVVRCGVVWWCGGLVAALVGGQMHGVFMRARLS
jgi:hypothetical protein